MFIHLRDDSGPLSQLKNAVAIGARDLGGGMVELLCITYKSLNVDVDEIDTAL